MNLALRIGSWAAAIALMAAAMWLYDLKPHLDGEMQDPIAGRGRIGTVVGNRVFSVRVDRVDVASAVVRQGLSEKTTIPSAGIFVIVYLRIKSNKEPYTPGHVKLLTRGGVSYQETGRPNVTGRSTTYEAMLWGQASYVFEIPKDRLAGARLFIGESRLLDQFSAAADVDLGIDDRKAAQLTAHAPRDYVLKTL